MRQFGTFCLTVILLIRCCIVEAQSLSFTRHLGMDLGSTLLLDMAQDQRGYLWFASGTKGLLRYDGKKFQAFTEDPENSNSLVGNRCGTIHIDRLGRIWVSVFSRGLQCYDPATETFTLFSHNDKDSTSLVSNYVTAILTDRNGQLWVGTQNGLDRYDSTLKGFRHYRHSETNRNSISSNNINLIYEDKAGDVWIGCGNNISLTLNEHLTGTNKDVTGGLNRFNRSRDIFSHYTPAPTEINSTAPDNDDITAIFEDSRNRFWVGTSANGFYMFDRSTGLFTPQNFGPVSASEKKKLTNGGKLSPVTVINEDPAGDLLVGSFLTGFNRYFTANSSTEHFGNSTESPNDSTGGFTDLGLMKSLVSRDGVLWLISTYGSLYSANLKQARIPYYTIEQSEANSLYLNEQTNELWIGTNGGLLCRNILTGSDRVWNTSSAKGSLPSDQVYSIRPGAGSHIWLGTADNGLVDFDPVKNTSRVYKTDTSNTVSIVGDNINALCYDNNRNLWIGTESGLSRMNTDLKTFTNFRNSRGDSSTIVSSYVVCLANDKKHSLWIGTSGGLDRYDLEKKTFTHYLPGRGINSVMVDSAGVTWAGLESGTYFYDKSTDSFLRFPDNSLRQKISEVIAITEDNEQAIWVSTRNNIVKIAADRKSAMIYGSDFGVKDNLMGFGDNFKTSTGELFIGQFNGYYRFKPSAIKIYETPPVVNFTSLHIGDSLILPGKNNILTDAIWRTSKIELAYQQNNFSLEFEGVDFSALGDKSYRFMLKNYDDSWHDLGTDHRAWFIDLRPGEYELLIQCIASDGQEGNASLAIIIRPPWWRTWWAYTLFAIVALLLISAFIAYRSRQLRQENKILEERVTQRTSQLEESLAELKATQAQLIQSEKMASLGELTAGIAHEIQNPLNFVNNFSEINNELIEELKTCLSGRQGQMEQLNAAEQDELLTDIFQNNEKITLHGKRADAIVKGMLQHSRKSTGEKEPTDINALAEEYLKLAYHGMRAKDKSFNVTMKTDFDAAIGKINVIPQDIGRVLLNIYTNAFYAAKPPGALKGDYNPTVEVTTKKAGNKVIITISDNGSGIPDAIKDKIFQPFFTTKPTGQGTGLGLSLAYDIVKAHGGEIRVDSTVGEGTSFTVTIPFH